MAQSDAGGINACPIRSEADLVMVRGLLRAQGMVAGLGVVGLTKFITAGSELARNIIKYAGDKGGMVRVEPVEGEQRKGVRATFSDQGAGIADIEAALRDGYSTGGSLGMGLPGAKRLVDGFSIQSIPGKGTVVVITLWRR